MENLDTLNLSSDQLRGLLSLLMEGKLQQVVGQGAKSIVGRSEMDVLTGTTQGNSNTKSAGGDGDTDFNVSSGSAPSSLGDPAAAEYTARELLEKAGKCKKANPAQQIFRVSELWFFAPYIY